MPRAAAPGSGRRRDGFRRRHGGAAHRSRRDPAEALRARRASGYRAHPGARARPPVSTTSVRLPQEYEDAYGAYYAEAAEEYRAVRVGEKETSERAAIVARHADLFTRGQLELLRAAEADATDDDPGERLHRLRRCCGAGGLGA